MTCAKCSTPIEVIPGRGRPRKYCVDCSPRRRSLKSVQMAMPLHCLVPGCSEQVVARDRCKSHYSQWWRTQNPDYAADWKRKRPEYHAEYLRQSRAEHPEACRAISQRSYAKNRKACIARSVARKRGIRMASPETLEYRAVLTRDPCAYCGAACEDIDHIEAVVWGGSNEWTNLTPACRTCNARKGKQDLLRFLHG